MKDSTVDWEAEATIFLVWEDMERVWGRNGSRIESSKEGGREVESVVRSVRAEMARVVRRDEDYHQRV